MALLVIHSTPCQLPLRATARSDLRDLAADRNGVVTELIRTDIDALSTHKVVVSQVEAIRAERPEMVVAVLAEKHVITTTPAKDIIAGPTKHHIVAPVANRRETDREREGITWRTKGVVAGLAAQHVVTAPSFEVIVAGSAADQVVATVAKDCVVPRKGNDHIRARRPVEDVVTCRPEDRRL